jgi:hypothetical protein
MQMKEMNDERRCKQVGDFPLGHCSGLGLVAAGAVHCRGHSRVLVRTCRLAGHRSKGGFGALALEVIVKERQILFSAPMVRAILDGSKTQTRRAVKPQPLWIAEPSIPFKTPDADPKGIIRCPHGQPGDRLWVRETFFDATKLNELRVLYRADDDRSRFGWTPSIYMPRWASRITLGVTGVRVERLQDISEEDALSEGVHAGSWEYENGEGTESAKESFECLWESINGIGSWESNPWVWVVEFKRVQP